MGKEKHFLVADTESLGLGSRAITFDFAYTIATRKGIKLERSFLVREVLTNPALMFEAIKDNNWRQMIGGKLFSHYVPALDESRLKLYNWSEIVETLREDMRTFGVDVFAAYNLNFDMGAIARTQKKIKGGGKVLEYKPDLLCLWEFACSTVCKTRLYHQVARERGQDTGWITPANNVRTNAEKVYAFLSGDLDFVESHTALEDAQIETEILQRLLAKKTPIPYNVLDHMPWRRAQVLFGDMFDEFPALAS
jgi:hypothetical protein